MEEQKGYKVRDFRTQLFGFSVDLENMRYTLKSQKAIDADLTDGQVAALIASVKQAEQALDELRARLFDYQR